MTGVQVFPDLRSLAQVRAALMNLGEIFSQLHGMVEFSSRGKTSMHRVNDFLGQCIPPPAPSTLHSALFISKFIACKWTLKVERTESKPLGGKHNK